ncbi:MAG TPA: hypothetical protein ENI23_17445 [bacterium]|nr:hypothetical protein [bacterium]
MNKEDSPKALKNVLYQVTSVDAKLFRGGKLDDLILKLQEIKEEAEKQGYFDLCFPLHQHKYDLLVLGFKVKHDTK